MTVSQLIEQLRQFDPNLPVVAYLYDPNGTTERPEQIVGVQQGKSPYKGYSKYVAVMVELI